MCTLLQTTAAPSGKKNNTGIALIATLGLLSALLIMALGYATVMRTERTAAANATAIAQTRLLTMGVLDTVIFDLNRGAIPGATGVYPETPYLYQNSRRDAKGLLFGVIGRGGTKHFLPTLALEQINPSESRPGFVDWDVDWEEIQGPGGELLGVYAKIIVDESGRLDLNYAGASPYDEGSRNQTTNLFLERFSNIGGPGVLDRIIQEREDSVRFYNQAELRYANSNNFPKSNDWLIDDHFTTYSKFTQRYVQGTTDERRLDISETTNSLPSIQTAILNAANDAGLPASFYASLLDYSDVDDAISGGPFGYCTEAVPMISEILVSNSIDGVDGTSVTNEWRIGVELWYPFVSATSNTTTYNLDMRATYTGANPPQLNSSQYEARILDNSITVSNRFMVFWSNPVETTWTNLFSLANAEVTVVGFLQDENSQRIDAFPQSDPIVIDIGGANPTLGGGDVYRAVEVDDPRINWRPSVDWVQTSVPTPTENTLGETNSISMPGDDGDIYIANTSITNVGELGFIALGDPGLPWTSVDLLTNSAVLDVFTVHTNEYEHGLVNANSNDREVLASAIYGATLENYPGDPAGVEVNWPRANYLAASITNYTQSSMPGSFFDRLGEIIQVPAFTNGTVTGAQVTENEKESLVRGCADLLDVRGNTHTIVLAVRSVRDRDPGAADPKDRNDPNQSYDGPLGDPTLGEQIAVAQVWRDPVSKESEITFLKWVSRSD